MPRFCANLTMLWNELDFVDRFAAAAKAGFTGVEYLFPYDHDKAIEYATALGCKQLNCLAGIAPAGVTPEQVRETFVSNLKLIPHMQLADNPGRNEPGAGEINYPFLFEHMDQVGYAGWIGCEYKPRTTTDAGLGWIKPDFKR